MLTEKKENTLRTRLLLACGVLGPLLFIVIFLIEGVLRPDYSAWHNYVSDLSEGDQGWTQIANFVLCGLCVLCFTYGLRQVLRSGKGALWGPLLLGVFGCSLIIAGLFVKDPSLGYYPPGVAKETQTWHGIIHGISAPFAFGSLSSAIFVLARRFAGEPLWSRWAVPSLVTGILLLGSFIACLVIAVLDQNGVIVNSPAGLLERIAIVLGWGWISALALRLWLQIHHTGLC